jgi:branched-chain amino acid transport system permease protein
MADFVQTYGFLIVTIIQQALLAMSLYYPLAAGQLSLATPGFYAIGGYIAAVMGTADSFSPLRQALGSWMFPLEWCAAALVSAILSLLVGAPALRLRGLYLALATIAFVEIVRVISLNLAFTGGAVGIFGIPQLFESRRGYLLVFVPLLLVMLYFSRRLSLSRAGRAFRAIREDELAADAMGINTTRYKVLAFAIGGTLAGCVGAMSAPLLNTWNARQGTFDLGVACLAYVLIGGSRSIWGPLLGACLLAALPEVLRPLKDSRLIFNGMVLILVSVYLPNGIAGLIRHPAVRRRGASPSGQDGAS